MSDRVFAALCLVLCGLVAFSISAITVPVIYEPVGPKAFPLLLVSLMAICCVFLIVRPEPGIRWPERAMLVKGALLIAALFAYAALFQLLGFPLASALMGLVLVRLFGGSWLAAILASPLLGVGLYLAFDRLFQVTLPTGLMWS